MTKALATRRPEPLIPPKALLTGPLQIVISGDGSRPADDARGRAETVTR